MRKTLIKVYSAKNSGTVPQACENKSMLRRYGKKGSV